MSWQNKFILLADYNLSWQDHKNRIKEQTEDLEGHQSPGSSPFSLPLPPFSPFSLKNPSHKASHTNKLFFLLLSLILSNPLKTLGFRGVLPFFWRGKPVPEGLGKRERRREDGEDFEGVWWGEGRSFCFFSCFFSWEISKGKGGERERGRRIRYNLPRG